MKQTVFMVLLTLAGTAGVFAVSPFLGVAVYYTFAVLRPQSLWQWSLPPGIAWSYYVAMATILAAAAGALGGQGTRRFTAGHSAVLAFGAWIGVSYVMARNQDAGTPYVIEYFKIFIMFIASAALLSTVRHLWLLLCFSALALAYIAYEVNFLYLAYGYLGIYHNGYSGLDNNGAGLMLAMGIPLCYFAWEGGGGWLRWCFPALIPVLLHAVLMTYSRGAMVSLLAVAPLIALRSRHRGLLMLAALGLTVLIPVLAGPQIRARFLSTSNATETDASAQSRLGSWAAAWRITMDNPVFGVGVRNANLYSYQYGADMEGRTIHNTYLQISADNGLVGLALYLFSIIVVWRGLREASRRAATRNEPSARQIHALAAGIECSFAVFAVGCVFLSLEIFELPYLLLLMGAQLFSVTREPWRRETVPRPARAFIAPARAWEGI